MHSKRLGLTKERHSHITNTVWPTLVLYSQTRTASQAVKLLHYARTRGMRRNSTYVKTSSSLELQHISTHRPWPPLLDPSLRSLSGRNMGNTRCTE